MRVQSLAEFTDPRLVAIYDSVNPYAPDAQPGFYLQLAAELGAHSIVDLGCGTGLITCEFARRGYRVIGVDPAPAMIGVARRRADCDGVRWIVGDASSLGNAEADLAIMTGHVAQFFVTDESWLAALTALRGALRAGGRLAFETRNPDAREWESWANANRSSVEVPRPGGSIPGPRFKTYETGSSRTRSTIYSSLQGPRSCRRRNCGSAPKQS